MRHDHDNENTAEKTAIKAYCVCDRLVGDGYDIA